MPDYDEPFELITDACGFSVGAALLQKGQPIIFCAENSLLLSKTVV